VGGLRLNVCTILSALAFGCRGDDGAAVAKLAADRCTIDLDELRIGIAVRWRFKINRDG
jgi:hypothetical protein